MKQLIFVSFLFLSSWLNAQDLELNPITPLESGIGESSGLVRLNDRLLSHNDSGGANAIYEVDATTGLITRTVVIANASNTDWEDIALNATYIYIGDFGNNNGSRTDLKIYRIAIADYLTTSNDTVYADTLAFSYADQVDFTPSAFTTIYDCEAMIATTDSIFLFTKNWGDFKSNVYGFPNLPGDYSAIRMDSLNPEMLVTGADLDTLNNEVMLIGYSITTSFAYHIKTFTHHKFSSGSLTKFTFLNPNSIQIEGIAFNDACYFVASENHSSGNAFLNEACFVYFGTEENENSLILFPNPTSDHLEIIGEFARLMLYNIQGQCIAQTADNNLDLSNLPRGVYTAVVLLQDGYSVTKKIILN